MTLMLISPFSNVIVLVVLVVLVEALNTSSLYTTLTASLYAEKTWIDMMLMAGSGDNSMA